MPAEDGIFAGTADKTKNRDSRNTSLFLTFMTNYNDMYHVISIKVHIIV